MSVIMYAMGELPIRNGTDGQKNFEPINPYDGTASAGYTLERVATPSDFPNWPGDYVFKHIMDTSLEKTDFGVADADDFAGTLEVTAGGGGPYYYQCAISFDSTIGTTDSSVRLPFIYINEGTPFQFLIEANGDWTLRSGGLPGTVRATVTKATLGQTTAVIYWLLVEYDGGNDRIRLWIAPAKVSDPQYLADPTKWADGSEVFDFTHTDVGAGLTRFGFGTRTVGLNSAAGEPMTMYSAAHMTTDVRPTAPVMAKVALITGNGAASATNWDEQDGTPADFAAIDDPISAVPDDDTTCIISVVAGSTETAIYSATHESCATIGLRPGDVVQALMGVTYKKVTQVGPGIDGGPELGLYYNGNYFNQDVFGDNNSGIYRPVWVMANTPQPGGSWTQQLADDTEWAIRYFSSVGVDDTYRHSAGAVYVIYSPGRSIPKQNRSSQRALLVR